MSRLVTVWLSEEVLSKIAVLKEKGTIRSRSDFIRNCVHLVLGVKEE